MLFRGMCYNEKAPDALRGSRAQGASGASPSNLFGGSTWTRIAHLSRSRSPAHLRANGWRHVGTAEGDPESERWEVEGDHLSFYTSSHDAGAGSVACAVALLALRGNVTAGEMLARIADGAPAMSAARANGEPISRRLRDAAFALPRELRQGLTAEQLDRLLVALATMIEGEVLVERTSCAATARAAAGQPGDRRAPLDVALDIAEAIEARGAGVTAPDRP